MPSATVVIPTWRRPDWLERCLAAVFDQDLAPQAIIVVGREEDAPTKAVVDRYPNVTWRSVRKPGHVEPLRVALSVVQTTFMVVIDDDAVPTRKDWLANLLKPFAHDVACVGGQVFNVGAVPYRVPKRAGQLTWYGRVPGNVARRRDDAVTEVSAVQEANWAWRTEVLSALDMPPIWDDGDATMYGLDLCLQARAAGWRILLTPFAPVDHFLAPRDSVIQRSNLEELAFAYSRNMTYISLKRLGARVIPFLFWSTLVGEQHHYGVVRAVFDLVTRKRSLAVITASLRGRWAGAQLWLSARRPAADERQPG